MTSFNSILLACAFVVGSNALGAIPKDIHQPPQIPKISAADDCTRVCADIRGRIKANSKLVGNEYELWQERLGVKADVIRYPQGFSAAEELLRFMSTYYITKAPPEQMQPSFLAYAMGKCFPEAYIDTDRARLSGLVDTIWVAQNLRVAGALKTCK